MSPYITIAIPVYNVEPYIKECLLSALNQDFTNPYEILLIDDCGTDKSMDIVKQVVSRYDLKRIVRIVCHPENKGLGPARNTAIQEARGQYLFFLDSDDIITSNCLTQLYNEAVKNNNQITVGSCVRFDDLTGTVKEENVYAHITDRRTSALYHLLLEGHRIHIEVWNKLYETEFLRSNNIHCYTRIFEDVLFDFEAYALASRVSLISDVTLRYRIRDNSIMTSSVSKEKIEQNVETRLKIIKIYQQLLEERYRKIYGIYDFYLSQLFIHFYSFAQLRITEEQRKKIKEQTAGFTKVIPGYRYVKSPLYRRLYLVCRFHDEIDGFWKTWDLREMSAMEQLFWYPIKVQLHKFKERFFFSQQKQVIQ